MQKLINRRRIVLTGAWGAGKTTFINELLSQPIMLKKFILLPEIAPLTKRIGFHPENEAFEFHVLANQHALEDAADYQEYPSDQRILLTHRGSLDALGFWLFQGNESKCFFEEAGTPMAGELARYDTVIFFQTTAQGMPEVYSRYSQANPRPDSTQAAQLENCLKQAWHNHPRFFFISNQTTWEEKAVLAKTIIQSRIPPDTPLSIDHVNYTLQKITYPSTHQYTISKKKHISYGESARDRLTEFAYVLPNKPWTSLIDIGCAKGMFLLWLSKKFHLKWAIGLDTDLKMVHAARDAVDFLRVPATIFHGALSHLHPILPVADLVVMLHCYHHLYFGFSYDDPGCPSHDTWFRILASITRDTLLFANPLELDSKRLRLYKQKNISDEIIADFNTNAILESADNYFDLKRHSLGGMRPYIIMEKKQTGIEV